MWPFAVRNACVAMSIVGVLSVAASAQTPPAVPRVPTSPRADYKVVIWYRQDRPLDTFKYQIYDVRKGEYTPAVDAWLELMRIEAPGLSRGGPVRRPEPREGQDGIPQGGLGRHEGVDGRGQPRGDRRGRSDSGRVVAPPLPAARSLASADDGGTTVLPGWGRPDRSTSIPPRTRIPFPCPIRGRIRDGVSPHALTGQGRQPSLRGQVRTSPGRSPPRRSANWPRAGSGA